MIHTHLRMKEDFPNAIIAIKAGDFWEVLGDDADYVAGIMGCKVGKRYGTKCTGIPFHAFYRLSELMTTAGKELVVVDGE